MANIIRIKRGENILDKNITLLAGELALDTVSGVLYTGDSSGNPVEIKGTASGTVAESEKADYAARLETAQLIKLLGDVTGEASFDGSAAAEITATLATITTGATVNGITFNDKGLITGAEEITYAVEDIDGLQDALDAKVDKVEGKSLVDDTEIERLASVTNYDDTEIKTALDSKLESSDLEGYATTTYVDNKVGNIDFSTLATKAEVESVQTTVDGKADKATTLAGYGITDAYTKTEIDTALEGYTTDEEFNTLSGKVTTAEGEIDTLQTQVAAKAEASNVYTKTEIDTTVEGINTAIGNKANTADVYTKTEIDTTVSEINGKLTSAMHYKGTVENIVALEGITEPALGDVYNITETGDNYAWNGTDWDKLSGTVDLSAYYTKTEVNTELDKKLDKETFNTTIANYTTTADLNATLATKADTSTVEVLTQTVGEKASIDDVELIEGRVTTAEGKIDNLTTQVAAKADKATTLAGYGITDAYTKDEVHTAVQEILDGTKVLTDDTVIDGGQF